MFRWTAWIGFERCVARVAVVKWEGIDPRWLQNGSEKSILSMKQRLSMKGTFRVLVQDDIEKTCKVIEPIKTKTMPMLSLDIHVYEKHQEGLLLIKSSVARIW